jgi:hypothetical protein
MARSSGMPTGRPLMGITRIIRARSRSVTIQRPTETTNSLDTTTETLDEHTEQLWLFQPTENVSQEITGERINGSLGALVVADTPDIQKNDRLTHGGVEYEVDTIVGHPEDGAADGTQSPDTDFFMVDLVRWQ